MQLSCVLKLPSFAKSLPHVIGVGCFQQLAQHLPQNTYSSSSVTGKGKIKCRTHSLLGERHTVGQGMEEANAAGTFQFYEQQTFCSTRILMWEEIALQEWLDTAMRMGPGCLSEPCSLLWTYPGDDIAHLHSASRSPTKNQRLQDFSQRPVWE